MCSLNGMGKIGIIHHLHHHHHNHQCHHHHHHHNYLIEEQCKMRSLNGMGKIGVIHHNQRRFSTKLKSHSLGMVNLLRLDWIGYQETVKVVIKGWK